MKTAKQVGEALRRATMEAAPIRAEAIVNDLRAEALEWVVARSQGRPHVTTAHLREWAKLFREGKVQD